MASPKVMTSSSNSRNSDLYQCRTFSSSSSTKPKSSLADQTHNHNISSHNSNSSMNVDGLLRNVYGANPTTESTFRDAHITLIDTAPLVPITGGAINSSGTSSTNAPKTVDEVWREIVAGERKECKEEVPDEMMTLEDFLVRAGEDDDDKAVQPQPLTERLSSGLFGFDLISRSPLQALDKVEGSIIGFGNGIDLMGSGSETPGVGVKAGEDDDDVKAVQSQPLTERLNSGLFSFDPISPSPLQALDKVEGSIIGFGNGIDLMGSGGETPGVGGIRVGGRGKRGRAILEPLDKAAQQKQRRMIKNRESAARSRERKQAYQVELETLAVRLEEENARLMQEKADKSKERYKQLMEEIVPIEEKRRPKPALGRVRSL